VRTPVVVAFIAAVLVGLSPARAQEATPAASPVVPANEECDGEALTLNELLPLISAGSGAPTPVVITPVPLEDIPAGTPADAETVAALDATVRELVACANARDPFRAVALISERYAQELANNLLAIQAGAEVDVRGLLPLTLPENIDPNQPVAVRPVTEARVLEDGRAGALVYASSAGLPGVEAVGFVLFVEEDGRWLIDRVIPVAVNVAPATPAA
jgi:hypothetical protein